MFNWQKLPIGSEELSECCHSLVHLTGQCQLTQALDIPCLRVPYYRLLFNYLCTADSESAGDNFFRRKNINWGI